MKIPLSVIKNRKRKRPHNTENKKENEKKIYIDSDRISDLLELVIGSISNFFTIY